jgi:hypothetical protein
MKYAVYVKYRRSDDGGDEWGGNQDRTDESREVAERETVANLKKHFPIERVLKVISFEYGDDELPPSFCDMTDRADKEDRKEFALVEIADALRRGRYFEPIYQNRTSGVNIWTIIALISQITVLLLLILRML